MISDELLALYYYDELSAGERTEVEVALAQDAELALRFAEMKRQFQQWRAPDAVQIPPHLTHRWHESIDRLAGAAGNESRGAGTAPRLWSFVWGASLAAALAAGIGIGVYLSDDATKAIPDHPLAGGTPPRELATPASFSRSLQMHLKESEWEIDRLPLQAEEDRAMLTMQIIAQNRMFERAAMLNDSPQLARVLRAFEPILLRLASDDIAPQDAEALRAQLSFEFNVVLTRLAQNTSDRAQSI